MIRGQRRKVDLVALVQKPLGHDPVFGDQARKRCPIAPPVVLAQPVRFLGIDAQLALDEGIHAQIYLGEQRR